MNNKRSNPDFLNGVPELLILKLISQRPMYGYQLVQAIRENTGEALSFGEGCIYPLLHKLEQREYLASRKEVVRGRSRVVYRVTKKGQTSLAQSAAEWQRIARAITQVLHGGEHGRVAFT
jgi:PadR family transcriptional regulator PadR